MSRTIPSSIRHPTDTTTPPTELSFEARLAVADAAMTVRLDEASVAYEVRTALIPTEPADLADIVTVPVAPAPHPLPDPYPTPVAALLQRAHHRLVTDGWCSGALIDAAGARCLLGAIRAEASGNRAMEARGLEVLMDAIRRKFGEIESVPSFNDAWANSRIPMRMLGEAAVLADARGI